MINTQNILSNTEEIFKNIFADDVDPGVEEEQEQNITESKSVHISDYNFGKK